MLTAQDKLKLEVLFDVFTQQVEYTMSPSYNNDELWSIEERVKDLIDYIELTATQDIKTIVDGYGGTEVFDSTVRHKLNYYLKEYSVGDDIELRIDVGKIVALEGGSSYGILINNSVQYITTGTISDLVKHLTILGVYNNGF